MKAKGRAIKEWPVDETNDASGSIDRPILQTPHDAGAPYPSQSMTGPERSVSLRSPALEITLLVWSWSGNITGEMTLSSGHVC